MMKIGKGVRSCVIACACALVAGSAALAVEPRPITWVGGSSGVWENSANWQDANGDPATPQNYDVLVFRNGGTFTRTSTGYVSFYGITVDTAEAVTLDFGTVAPYLEGAAKLTVTNGATVTLQGPLKSGYKTADHVDVYVSSGSTLNLNGDLTGLGGYYFKDVGTVNFNSANTYAGWTSITKGQIHVYNDEAFGVHTNPANDKTEIRVASMQTLDDLKVYFHGVTMGEYLDMTTHRKINNSVTQPIIFPTGTVNTFTGTVYHSSAVMYKFEGNAKVIHSGFVRFANPSFGFNAPAEMVFAGTEGSCMWDDYMSGSALIRYQTPMRMHSSATVPQASIYWFRIYGANPSRTLECENAMYSEGVLSFPQWQANGSLDICGHDQRFWTMACSGSFTGGSIDSSSPATVHLSLEDTLSKADTSLFAGKVKGQVSISCEGPKPLTFGGLSTSTGTFSLTNGADITFTSDAEWAGKTVNITGGSQLTLNGAALPDDVSIAIADDPESGAKSKLKLLANQQIGALTINGVPVETGKTIGTTASQADIIDDEHFAGAGQIAVGSASFDPTEATWTAGGADTLLNTVDNWDIAPKLPNLVNGLVTFTFGDAGNEALLPFDVAFNKLVFSGRDFYLGAAPAAPTAKLQITAGSIESEDAGDDANHVQCIDVPIEMGMDTFTVKMTGAKNTLILSNDMTSAGAASIAFSKRGMGRLYTYGANAVPGARHQYDGRWYATGASLGPDGTTVNIHQTEGETRFYLNGGTFPQKFTIQRSCDPPYMFGAVANSTNLLTKQLSFNDSYGISFEFGKNSSTHFADGFKKTGSWAGMFDLQENAEVIIDGRPFDYDERSLPARFYSYQPSGRCRLEFGCTAGYATMGLAIAGGIDVHFTADRAFDTTTNLTACLYLNRYGANQHPKLHLHGTDQYFGSIVNGGANGLSLGTYPVDTDGAEVCSEEGGTLHIRQSSNDGHVLYAAFRGNASLEKSGDKTLKLGGASSSAGTLTVSDGTVEFYGGNAGWTNVSQVVVTGGTLKVDDVTRLKPFADYALAGGTLEIAGGVTLRGESLTLPDGQGGTVTTRCGEFTAANCPYISGAGRLLLKTGAVLIFR